MFRSRKLLLITVVFLAGLLIRIRTVSDSAAHLDEAYTFFQVGNLELGNDWKSVAAEPSLPRWLAVPGFLIGGQENAFALRSSPLIGWSMMFWAITALLLRQNINHGAVAAAFFMSFEPTMIGYSLYMKQDMVLAGCIAIMLIAAISKRRVWSYLAVGLPLACKWTGGVMPLILAIYWCFKPPSWMKGENDLKTRFKAIAAWGLTAICAMLAIFVLLNPWFIQEQPGTIAGLRDSTAFDTTAATSDECKGACAKTVFGSSSVWWFYLPFHLIQLTPLLLGCAIIGLLSIRDERHNINEIVYLGVITWGVCFVTYSIVISIDARHYAPVFFPGILLLAGAGFEKVFASEILASVLTINDSEVKMLAASIGFTSIIFSSIAWAGSLAPEYREWVWYGDEDPYGGSTRTMWEERIVMDALNVQIENYTEQHPDDPPPRLCTTFIPHQVWFSHPSAQRNYAMDSIERNWGNCEFIIYSKYWVNDNLQHEGVKLLYDIWHGAEDDRFETIRPKPCQEIECHLMAFKVTK